MLLSLFKFQADGIEFEWVDSSSEIFGLIGMSPPLILTNTLSHLSVSRLCTTETFDIFHPGIGFFSISFKLFIGFSGIQKAKRKG